jgi:hypothetical protein
MGHEQRVIIKFLVNYGLGADEIEEKLRTQFTENAYSLRTMQFWIAGMKRVCEDIHDEPHPGRPPAADFKRRTQEVLDHNPFESARSIAEILQISHSTLLKHLQEDLGFQCCSLR